MKNILLNLLPRKLVPVILALTKINEETPAHQFAKADRKILLRYLKEFPVAISALGGYNQAIITRGGINLKEINPRTMESTLVQGLFFTGEILDLEGPTGGYNLQVCWSTGIVAGESQ
jgi:predicted Rossmann fold flavoprotein